MIDARRRLEAPRPRTRCSRALGHRVWLLLAAVLVAAWCSAGAVATNSAAPAAAPLMGLVCTPWSSRDVEFSARLGNRLCRVEFGIGTRPSTMEAAVGDYARAGIRVQPLAGFEGRMPTERESRNLRAWALRFGPRGTFWKGKTYRLPILNIEFGNETSYSHQYEHTSTWSTSEELAARARGYALRVKDASNALRGTGVGLLVQAEDGDANNSVWVDQMFAAVPDLAARVRGWTIHPYGTRGSVKIDRMIRQLAEAGAPSSIPIYVTEWGLASMNGRRLSDNYGYAADMSYAEAAVTLRSVMARWRAAYGSRIAEVSFYMIADLDRPGPSRDRERYFGALKLDGSDKGKYTVEIRKQLARGANAATTRAPSAG